MYFCDKWNNVIDWTKSKYIVSSIEKPVSDIAYIEADRIDGVGSRRWDFHSITNLVHVIKLIETRPNNTITFLPFDQSGGCLYNLLNLPLIKYDLAKIFNVEATTSLNKYICIHIRRGDVSDTKHPSWFVDNDFYLNLLSSINIVAPLEIPIVICTQGDASWIDIVANQLVRQGRQIFVSTIMDSWINSNEINDFALMLNSDVLFMAGSSFSHIAGYFGGHGLLFDIDKGGTSYQHKVHHICSSPQKLEASLEDIKCILKDYYMIDI
ncbi:Glycosyl transferase family 11 [Prochlorococcus marinus str. MIT 1342]|nr:Glycosyl transferase family 11 [Prochlorococcus marinus str. MIT 1342]